MAIRDKLASKLKRLIQDTPDLSQRIVANRADISESYLSGLLAGKRRAHIDLLEKVANACGTSLQALIPPSTPQEPYQHSNLKVEELMQASGALKDESQADSFGFAQLSDSEKRIVKLYRRLNNERKQRVIDFVIEVLLGQYS